MFICIICVLSFGCSKDNNNIKVPNAPTKNIYVQDNAKMLNSDFIDKINIMGKELDNKYKAQVVVVTVESLDGYDIETYSNTLFRKWGIGNKDKNNGVLLLISKNDKKFRIETGYGLEGKIPDGYAGRELDKMKPLFKNGKYSEGVFIVYRDLVSKIYEEYGDKEAKEEIIKENIPHTPGTFESILLFLVGLTVWELGGLGVLLIIILVVLYKLGFFGLLFDILTSIGGSSGGSGDSGGFGGGSSGGGGASGGW